VDQRSLKQVAERRRVAAGDSSSQGGSTPPIMDFFRTMTVGLGPIMEVETEESKGSFALFFRLAFCCVLPAFWLLRHGVNLLLRALLAIYISIVLFFWRVV
jgi:hypothetical protein